MEKCRSIQSLACFFLSIPSELNPESKIWSVAPHIENDFWAFLWIGSACSNPTPNVNSSNWCLFISSRGIMKQWAHVQKFDFFPPTPQIRVFGGGIPLRWLLEVQGFGIMLVKWQTKKVSMVALILLFNFPFFFCCAWINEKQNYYCSNNFDNAYDPICLKTIASSSDRISKDDLSVWKIGVHKVRGISKVVSTGDCHINPTPQLVWMNKKVFHMGIDSFGSNKWTRKLPWKWENGFAAIQNVCAIY